MKKLFLFITLAVFPAIIIAQTSGKLAGSVTNASGEALAGANVLVTGTNLGGATDENGRYYILDVPVGVFSVEAQYIGYKTLTIDNVRINADLTTVLDMQLEVAAVEGEKVTVTAERPLINRSATNTNQIVDSEVIEALPLRDVSSVVNLQSGVVDGHVRGGRSGDNAYYIDGVLVKNRWSGGNLTSSLSYTGTEQISVQAGGFSAEYGGANGGIINVATKSGSDNISGGVEMVQDLGTTTPGTDKNAMYSYGTQIFNFDVGGPLSSNIRWYLNAELESSLDYSPSYAPAPFADVAVYTQDQWESMGYDTLYSDLSATNMPAGMIYADQFVKDNQTNVDSLIAGAASYDTTYVTASNYQRKYGPKRNSGDNTTKFFGNLLFDMSPLRLKVGGGYYGYEQDTYSQAYHLLNWNNNRKYKSNHTYGYLNATFALSSKSYVKAIASMNQYHQEYGNRNLYGRDNIDNLGKRETSLDAATYYYRDHGKNTLSVTDLVNFAGYGSQVGYWLDRDQNTLGLRTDFVSQTGAHEIKAGMEYYSTTIREYYMAQGREIYENISKMDADYNGTVTAAEVGDYNGDGTANAADLADWKFSTYRNAYVHNLGYNIFGDETDSYARDDHSQAPGKPVEMRLYLQDKIELKDVVVQLGMAFESFNPSVQAPDGTSDGFDYVYLNNGRIDRTGAPGGGPLGLAAGTHAWKDVETHTALHPRLGFAFPVTDKTVFHAQYGTYWQTPPLNLLYLSDTHLSANLSQGNMTVSPNPGLKPERTTSYEVGFDQQIGQNAAVGITGFYKEIRDYIYMSNRGYPTQDTRAYLDGSEFSWAQYMNGDYGVTSGYSLKLTLRRVNGFLADLNYTFMDARGTGSAAGNNFNIAWTGESYPTTLNRLEYDQTHTGSMMVDYRNSRLDFGVNTVVTFGSGQAYTPSTVQSDVFGRGWNIPTASINSGSKPWTSRMDVRIDKGLNLGGVRLNAYLLVLNALNTENVYNVYNGSGMADDDAWLETPEGRVWSSSHKANYPSADGNSLYLDRLASPGNWGIPRIVRLGIQVNI